MGFVLVSPLLVTEISGVGSEARAYPARLARAKANGLDLGLKARIARETARPADARRAFDELEGFLRVPKRFALAKSKITPAEEETARGDLRRLGVLARQAQGGSHYDWAKGWALAFPSYHPLRESAKAADTLSRLDADRRDWTSATQNVVDSADGWRAYGEDPITIAELVRCAVSAILFRTSGVLLSRSGYPASEARRLAAIAEGPDFAMRTSLKEILVGEVSMQVGLLDDPKTLQELTGGGMTGPSQRDFVVAARMPQVRRAWQSDALRLMNDAVAGLPNDPYDFQGAKRAVVAYDTAMSKPRGLVGRFADVAGSVFLSGVNQAQFYREAQRRVLIVAAGLRAGEPEAALRARLGRFALDPYDGRPIRVRPAHEVPFWLLVSDPGVPASRFRAVYSIGKNGIDDGGTTGKQPAGNDIVLLIPRR